MRSTARLTGAAHGGAFRWALAGDIQGLSAPPCTRRGSLCQKGVPLLVPLTAFLAHYSGKAPVCKEKPPFSRAYVPKNMAEQFLGGRPAAAPSAQKGGSPFALQAAPPAGGSRRVFGKSQPWPRGSPGLCFLQCGKRPEGLLFSASAGFPRAACAPSVRLSTLFAWWSLRITACWVQGSGAGPTAQKKRRRLRLSKNPGIDKGPQPLMFHPALATSASERRKTRRFSYFAGFAARELMREEKPVKARKSGVPPLFRHSEAAAPLFLLPEGRSRVPRDKAVRSLP